MPEKSEVLAYCAADMVDDNTSQVGGAVDKTARPVLKQPATAGTVRIMSESAADNTQTITVKGTRLAGKEINEDIGLNGLTEVAGTLSFALLSEVSIDGSHAGACCVVFANVDSGTAQGGGANYIQLRADCPDIDFKNMVVILGDGQLGRIIWFDTASKRAYVWPWSGSAPTGTTTYQVAPGAFLDKVPNEVTKVISMYRKIGSPDIEEASPVVLYSKVFLSNESQESKDFMNVTISEFDDTVTSGTAQGSGENYITLKADDTGGDDDYKDKFILITSGAGSGLIRKATGNTASNKRLYVRIWGIDIGSPDYEIHNSMRAKIKYALEDAVDDNGTADNRLTIPTGVSAFDDNDKVIPGGDLESGQVIGLWTELTLQPGDLPAVSHWPYETKWFCN
jgi:hypothetical protein